MGGGERGRRLRGVGVGVTEGCVGEGGDQATPAMLYEQHGQRVRGVGGGGCEHYLRVSGDVTCCAVRACHWDRVPCRVWS